MTSADLVFTPEGHEYRLQDGRVVPSVTTILSAVGVAVDFSTLGALSLRLASDIALGGQRGTAVHADCHAFDDDDLEWDTVDARITPYIKAWSCFRSDKRAIPIARERRVFHPECFYCGTLDGVFLVPPAKRILIDIKTGDPADSACRYQTAAYEAAWLLEHPDEPIAERWAVQLTPSRSVPYRITPYTDWRDFSTFRAFATTYHHQVQRRERV